MPFKCSVSNSNIVSNSSNPCSTNLSQYYNKLIPFKNSTWSSTYPFYASIAFIKLPSTPYFYYYYTYYYYIYCWSIILFKPAVFSLFILLFLDLLLSLLPCLLPYLLPYFKGYYKVLLSYYGLLFNCYYGFLEKLPVPPNFAPVF